MNIFGIKVLFFEVRIITMKKSNEEIIGAVHRLEAGEPKYSVSKGTGIDRKSLTTYFTRYKRDGESAFDGQRVFSLEEKLDCVNRILVKRMAIGLVSADTGIPNTTLKRWVKAYQDRGQEGLITKREIDAIKKEEERNNKEMFDRDCRCVNKVSDMVMRLLSDQGTEYEKSIPLKLKGWGVYNNPVFGTFLLDFYRACLMIKNSQTIKPKKGEYFSEESLKTAFAFARFKLMAFLHDGTKRKETERIIQEKETQIFLSEFAETIPIMFLLEEDNRNADY